MHDGCSGSFSAATQVLAKIRAMGFAQQFLPLPLSLDCRHCNQSWTMETFEDRCPHCDTIHGVTPCHAHDPDAVMALR
jgi:Zn finger protein HypA/HybF involved in hydrogenase expression